MTYPDPKRVRSHRLTLRLDEYEHKLLQALAEYQGDQLSTLLRDLVMREAGQVMALAHEPSVERRRA
jgi:uncharacterized protein (DUF1778 family)